MTEREFDHLTDQINLTPETADILIRDLCGMHSIFDRAFLEYDPGVSGYHDRAIWLGCSNHKYNRIVHSFDPKMLPLHNRSAIEMPYQILRSADKRCILGRRKRDSGRIPYCCPAYPDPIIDCSMSIAPCVSIDPYQIKPGIARIAWQHSGVRFLFA